jgi:conjugative relaxase-like TrwC/TraI family protein
MLTISKPLSAGQAQSYHQKEFTAKEQNYWSQRGVIAGEWQGRLASHFGLSGNVSAEDFARLSQGQHPETGEQLVRQRASYEYKDGDGKTIKTMEHRAGWDATFSAPKSVSLTALVGGDERVRKAHREAVDAALEQLEHYTQARIGGNHPPETSGKFIAAKFEHDTARPVDGYVAPQLHTHAVIFNMTQRDNGQARAVQPQSLFASQQFATTVYQSELMYRLRQLGYEITPGRSGAPEIKGYTQEYLDASSPRSKQIREYLERTGRSGKEAAEIAAHFTRDRKEINSPHEVMAAHRKLAADFGHQADVVVRTARERSQQQTESVQPEQRVRESLTFARDKNFEREAVIDERALVRDALRRGMGDVTYPQVLAHLNGRLASGEFHIIERPGSVPGRQFTTAKTIEAEHEIVRRMREGRSQLQPVMTRSEAIQTADRHPYLNRAQKTVVEDVLSSPDRIQGIQGVAGAGKTTTLAALRSGVETHGYEVTGFAPISRAARQLNEAGIEGGTLQGFLMRSAKPETGEQKHFYFVDESSLASTKQVREFLARIGPNDRVLLIGDSRQHQGVEAGRPFEQLQQAGMQTAQLDQIVRQKDPELLKAVEHLSKNETAVGVQMLQQQGRVTEIVDPKQRIEAIAKSYAACPENTFIVSPDNASRRAINQAVREELQGLGTLDKEDHSMRVLTPRSDMTGADRAWAARYQTGDVLHYIRGSKELSIAGGSYAQVVTANPKDNLVTVQKPDGGQVTYDPSRLRGISAYREIEREFAAGDRIQFTAPNRALQVANRDLGTLQQIDAEGRMTIRMDGGKEKTISFDPKEMRHFDHGYAVTSHSSQGLNAERVLVNMDTDIHPELINSRFAYVSVSRASHDAQVFTNDAQSLATSLSHDVNKASAIDLSKGQSPLANTGIEQAPNLTKMRAAGLGLAL